MIKFFIKVTHEAWERREDEYVGPFDTIQAAENHQMICGPMLGRIVELNVYSPEEAAKYAFRNDPEEAAKYGISMD